MALLLASILDAEGFHGDILRALRQGIYFGVETRVPYAITGIIRPYLFGKQPRPLITTLKFYAEQGLKHGWIIARISIIFKSIERLLMTLQGVAEAKEWHTFIAGCIAGYFVMVRDQADVSLKRQVNMAIGIRVLYSFGSYIVRQGVWPGISHSTEGYARGQSIWFTLMWGVVMWHWRHQTIPAPGEMDKGQVNQMNFIYKSGDTPGPQGWFSNNYLPWLAIVLAVKYAVPEESKIAAWFGLAKSTMKRSMSQEALNFTMLHDFSDSEAMDAAFI